MSYAISLLKFLLLAGVNCFLFSCLYCGLFWLLERMSPNSLLLSRSMVICGAGLVWSMYRLCFAHFGAIILCIIWNIYDIPLLNILSGFKIDEVFTFSAMFCPIVCT